jgi:hypothetical protein
LECIAFHNLDHFLKPAPVASRWPSIGTASGKRNLCAGSYWSDGIPNVNGLRSWRREEPLGVYSFS